MYPSARPEAGVIKVMRSASAHAIRASGTGTRRTVRGALPPESAMESASRSPSRRVYASDLPSGDHEALVISDGRTATEDVPIWRNDFTVLPSRYRIAARSRLGDQTARSEERRVGEEG